MVRSQAREAAPVISGGADPGTVGVVLGGLIASDALARGLNPYVELLEARRLRDRICHRFLVKPADLTGTQDPNTRAHAAQAEMIRGLGQRRWWLTMVRSYLDSTISEARWIEIQVDHPGPTP